MSDRPHFMQLEANEDATSVRDRLSFVRGKRVLLVWPEEDTVLRRKLDLVLIQREAMRRAIRLAMVTHDPQVAKHASELNISTFQTIGESERKRWKRGRSKVFANRFQKPDGEVSAEDIRDAAQLAEEDEATFAITTTRTVAALLLVLLALFIAYALVPSATITITPARSAEQISTTITAVEDATDIDIENRIIPMTQLRVEIVANGTLETTGQVALSDTRAAGSVVFINRTPGPVDIPAGTVVATSAGTPIEFRTTEAATLPAGVGEQVEAPVEALQDYAGEIGNVGEGLINSIVGPVANSADVRNVTAMSGGTSQTAPAVTATDIERLEATVRQQIQAQAFGEMQPLLTDTQFIILETLVIAEEREDWKAFSAEIGDTTETVSLEMRAVVSAAAVDEQFGRQIVFGILSNQVPRERVIQPDSITYTRGTASEITSDGSVSFEMSASAVIVEPADEQSIRQQLINRTPRAALEYLLNDIDSHPGTVPELSLSPGWMRRLPLLPNRIDVTLLEAPV